MKKIKALKLLNYLIEDTQLINIDLISSLIFSQYNRENAGAFSRVYSYVGVNLFPIHFVGHILFNQVLFQIDQDGAPCLWQQERRAACSLSAGEEKSLKVKLAYNRLLYPAPTR